MSACQLARAKLAQYVANLRKAGSIEKTTTLVKAGFLTSPTSTLRNVAGNTLMEGLENFVTKPTAAGIDYILSLGKAERRTITSPLNRGGARALAAGTKEGVQKFREQMRTGIDVDRAMEKYDVHEVSFDTPFLQAFQRNVFNFMSAQDKPFWQGTYQVSLFERAQTLATREGWQGAEKATRIRELMARPTDEMALGAIEDANYATFKDQTALGTAASRLKTSLRDLGKPTAKNPKGNPELQQTAHVFHGLAEVTIPFTQVPTSIAGKLIDYSPLGFAKTLVRQLSPATRSQRGLALGTARALLGTGGLALGWALAKEGKMTGTAPTSPQERAQWDLEGKMPNAVQIGGRWYSLQAAAPVSMMPLLGANLYQAAAKNGQTTLGAAVTSPATLGTTAGREAKSLTEQTFLTGVSGAINALTDPDRSAGKFVTNVLGSAIPPVVGRVAQGVDQTVRAPETISERLQAKIPFASRALPPRVDAFGRPLEREGGLAKALLDPTSSRAAAETPLTREMDRLGFTVGMPGRSVTINGQRQRLTRREYNALLEDAGPQIESALTTLVTLPEYQTWDDETKREAMQDVVRELRRAALLRFRARRAGLAVEPDGAAIAP